MTYGIVPESVKAVQIACPQAVALYGCELWWDPKVVGRRDDLQLLLNRQARSILGALPMTPQGALMREAGLTPVPALLESRQQRFTARLANACSNKSKELHQNHSSGAPICRVVMPEHEHGQSTEGMNWPASGEEPVVRTIILDDDTTAKGAMQHWAREKEAIIRAGISMWWTDGSRSDDGRGGAAAVCKHRNEWRSRCSYLGTGHMEVIGAELWAIGLALNEKIRKTETLQRQGVKKVAVFSDSHAAIGRTAHLEPGLRQRVDRRINRREQALLSDGIATEILLVPGYSAMPGNQDADQTAWQT